MVVTPAADAKVVLDQVRAAAHITTVPASIEPSLSQAASDFGGNYEGFLCQAGVTEATELICTLGDPKADNLMFVYGDSHALMWIPAFEGMAKAMHWRLVVLGKPSCPAADVTVANTSAVGTPGDPDTSCSRWHRWAVGEINRLHPTMVIVTEENRYSAPRTSQTPSSRFTALEWQAGLAKLFDGITVPTEKVFLGNIPLLPQSGPVCMAAHPDDVRSCSTPVASTVSPLDSAERSEAAALHIRYVDPTPWFCSTVCTPVIGTYDVYLDTFHITGTYAKFLQNALAETLGFHPSP